MVPVPDQREQIVCLFCGGEMTSGKVLANQRLHWLPADKKERLFVTQDEVPLGQYSIWRGRSIDAHVCMGCKKLVADLQPYQ